jgi:HEAT repeat protein
MQTSHKVALMENSKRTVTTAITLVICLSGMIVLAASGQNSSTVSTGRSEKPTPATPSQAETAESDKPGTRKENRPPAPQVVTSRAWKLLEEGLKEKEVSKRTEAVSALAIIGPLPRALSFMETALTDEDPRVRETAVVALGEMKSRRSLARLKTMLEDDAPEVSFAAARTLWRMGDRSGRSILLEVLAGERKSSAGGLGRKLGRAREKLHDPKTLAKIGVTQGASVLLGPFAIGIKAAEQLRKDNSVAGRALAASLLAADRNPQSAVELEQALDDKDWLVRAAAARALAKRREKRALARLEALLDDDQEPVRYSAAAAILALS